MSYSTLDRNGGIHTTYAHARGGGQGGCTGQTWWPDFGPGSRDFSAQQRSHPSEVIFERIVKPAKWSTREKAATSAPPMAQQFRNPQPARDALLNKTEPCVETKLAAHAVTERQAALRRLEVRQRRMDAWLADAPIHSREASLYDSSGRSRSEPSLKELSSSQASQVSRDVYERHGYLVGRSKGSIADGSSGARPRRHNPLSYSAMMFSGNLLGDSSGRSKRSYRPRKPSKQWRTSLESSFVFDPQTSLPVPRGGWNSQRPSRWPEPASHGGRDVSFSGSFSRDPGMPALPAPAADG